MKFRAFLLFVGLLAFGDLDSLAAQTPAPSFTISATNVTMPSSGEGSIPFTLTSLNGYAGNVTVDCPEVNAPVGARVPSCGGGGPVFAFNLTANGTLTGSETLRPYGDTAPVPVLIVVPLLLGLGLRRRGKLRWPMLAMVLAGTLAGLGGIVGCGGGPPGMTPGIYAYTLTATDIKTNVAVSTTASVTVH